VWLAITVLGVATVARATATMNDRAVAQTNADSVALVAVDRGVDAAKDFARRVSIQVVALEMSGNMATATVRVGRFVATAGAVKPE
jgi:hypothetical protein